jgi:hypothetical protein
MFLRKITYHGFSYVLKGDNLAKFLLPYVLKGDNLQSYSYVLNGDNWSVTLMF